MQQLLDDLADGEIAIDAAQAAGAEDAAHAAADLRADAGGASPLVLNQHAFDELAVLKFNQQLVGIVAGTKVLGDSARQRHKRLAELFAQPLR